MKKCEYCGRENTDQAAHCSECGTPFVMAPGNAPTSPPDAPANPARAAAEKQMLSGALCFGSGLFVTAITYFWATNNPYGGYYIVAWGAILFGGIRFFRGLTGRTEPQPSKEDIERIKEDIGYEALGHGARLESKGQFQDALKLYQEIIEKFPGSDASKDAKQSIEGIKARLAGN